jgi:hypothetical protein
LHFHASPRKTSGYPLPFTRFPTRDPGFPCRDPNQLFRRLPFAGYISPQVRLPQNHKLLAFLPLVFVIGTEGFAIFAPYVVFVLVVAHLTRWLKPAAAAPAAITEPDAISVPA